MWEVEFGLCLGLFGGFELGLVGVGVWGEQFCCLLFLQEGGYQLFVVEMFFFLLVVIGLRDSF